MAFVIKALVNNYRYYNDEMADARTSAMFLMSSPWPMIAIAASYVYLSTSLGPRLMAKRKPFNVDKLMQIYNVVQIVLNAYLHYTSFCLTWLRGYSFQCEPVDYSWDPRSVAIARGVWLFFIIKIIDLTDTIFIVLRKKQNQVSFLHLYHHCSMILGSWMIVKYIPGGHAIFLGTINTFVHVIMYGHYLLTSLKIGKPWWKVYITRLQITQFIIALYHYCQLIWVPDCGFPKRALFHLIPQTSLIFILFCNFYIKAYIKKRPKKSNAKSEQNGATSAQNGANKETTNGKSKSR